jgi:hypothetical protein
MKFSKNFFIEIWNSNFQKHSFVKEYFTPFWEKKHKIMLKNDADVISHKFKNQKHQNIFILLFSSRGKKESKMMKYNSTFLLVVLLSQYIIIAPNIECVESKLVEVWLFLYLNSIK